MTRRDDEGLTRMARISLSDDIRGEGADGGNGGVVCGAWDEGGHGCCGKEGKIESSAECPLYLIFTSAASLAFPAISRHVGPLTPNISFPPPCSHSTYIMHAQLSDKKISMSFLLIRLPISSLHIQSAKSLFKPWKNAMLAAGPNSSEPATSKRTP